MNALVLKDRIECSSATVADVVSADARGAPVALLQLDGRNVSAAASAIYRERRCGRSVVAVTRGGAAAVARLAARLDQIGLEARRSGFADGLVHDEVILIDGPERVPQVRAEADTAARPLRVALAGCGVVGGGMLDRLRADPSFEVVGVLVRSASKLRRPGPGDLALTDPAALLAREPDVLIDALSDASTGLALIRASLARGVSVVTAGKQAVAADPGGLVALAAASGAAIAWSAAVGGGAPIVETVRRARGHGPVARIEAVLNGTCNFLLNRLAEGATFDAALEAARAAGFAEADPTDDLSGADAAAKLAILAWEIGARIPPEAVRREPLSRDFSTPGAVRQVAVLEAGLASIALAPVDGDPLFADLADEGNAVRVTTTDGRVFTARGRGAGREPTTESVWADLCDVRASRVAGGRIDAAVSHLEAPIWDG